MSLIARRALVDLLLHQQFLPTQRLVDFRRLDREHSGPSQALARALVMQPEALLLDEPFSALDPHLRRHLEEQLRHILGQFRGVTLFVTHDRDEAYRFCQDLVILAGGGVAAAGPKQEIFTCPGSLAVARLTGCKNFGSIAAVMDVKADQVTIAFPRLCSPNEVERIARLPGTRRAPPIP